MELTNTKCHFGEILRSRSLKEVNEMWALEGMSTYNNGQARHIDGGAIGGT